MLKLYKIRYDCQWHSSIYIVPIIGLKFLLESLMLLFSESRTLSWLKRIMKSRANSNTSLLMRNYWDGKLQSWKPINNEKQSYFKSNWERYREQFKRQNVRRLPIYKDNVMLLLSCRRNSNASSKDTNSSPRNTSKLGSKVKTNEKSHSPNRQNSNRPCSSCKPGWPRRPDITKNKTKPNKPSSSGRVKISNRTVSPSIFR